MNNPKINSLNHLQRMIKEKSVRFIIIEEYNGNKHGIANPEGIAAMMEAAIKVIKTQIEKEQ